VLTDQQPDAVLLDVQLGNEDGLSLAEWMRQQPKLCQIPVIAVTAHALACRAAAFLAGRLQRLRFQTCEFQATW